MYKSFLYHERQTVWPINFSQIWP